MIVSKDAVIVAVSVVVAVGSVGAIAARGRHASPIAARRSTMPRMLAGVLTVEYNAALVRGSAGAPYRVVEFMDYECPPCRMMNAHLARLVDHYRGKLAWKVRELPLPMHPNARPAALLAIASSRQVPYGRVHDALMNAPSISVEGRRLIARSLGLDTALVLKDLAAAKKSLAVDESSAASLGLNGTPSLILCTPSGRAWLLSSPADLDRAMDDEATLVTPQGASAAKHRRVSP